MNEWKTNYARSGRTAATAIAREGFIRSHNDRATEKRRGRQQTFRVLLSLSFPLRNKVPVETSIFLFKRPLGLDGHVYEGPWTAVADR